MNNRTVWTAVVLVWTIPSVGVASAAESPSVVTMGAAELDRRSGQPVDISPWAYAWRADRAIQTPPEACFIPRRLDRIDKVLGTPEVSADRRVWTYKIEPGAKMDWAYNARVDAATGMVAVFCNDAKAPNGERPSVKRNVHAIGDCVPGARRGAPAGRRGTADAGVDSRSPRRGLRAFPVTRIVTSS